jgi:hypothetical protein
MGIVRRPIVAAVCLLAWAGCRPDHSPGEGPGHEDHAGHVIPAHKPKSFPDAIRLLRELNRTIEATLIAGKAGSPLDDRTVPIALDIANWLPEIAAESDMPKQPWDEVNDRSAAIVSDYRAILAGAGDRGERVRHAGQAISGLEAVLDAADPRWFASPGDRDAAETPAAGPANITR